MAFKLKPLPFATNALEPHMSARTLEFHHGKHHKTYVETLNELIAGTEFEKMALEEIVRATAEAKDPAQRKIFDNAGQAWNHDFFWQCLSPDGGGEPDGEISDRIHKEFGSWQQFRTRFVEAATAQFGSGWAWLVEADGKLQVVTTANAMTPIVQGHKPLLVCDVWEHAYYLDYQNQRPKFVETFLDQLVNWDFAAQRLSLEGEGSYSGTRDYNAGVARSVAKGQSRQQAMTAAQALDSAEGDEMRAAEQAGKSRARGGARIEGEGSYAAARDYNAGVAKSVAKGQSGRQAQEAKRALEGAEGESLRAAEQEGRQRARGESQIEGEGSYSAARQYNSDLARSVAKGQAEHHAKQAQRALDGGEGADLRRAEQVGKSHARGEDPALKKPGKRG